MRLIDVLQQETGEDLDRIALIRHRNGTDRLIELGGDLEEATFVQPKNDTRWDFWKDDKRKIRALAVIFHDRVYGVFRILGVEKEGPFASIASRCHREYVKEWKGSEQRVHRRFAWEQLPSAATGQPVTGWESKSRQRTSVARGDGDLAPRIELELPEISFSRHAASTDTLSDAKATDLFVPKKFVSTTIRIVRDSELARRVKGMHDCECQICGLTIEFANGTRYAEAHHIHPLGHHPEGPDELGNMLCLCPNHHAECDLGVIKLSLSSLRSVDGHEVDQRHIEYHNRRIYLR